MKIWNYILSMWFLLMQIYYKRVDKFLFFSRHFCRKNEWNICHSPLVWRNPFKINFTKTFESVALLLPLNSGLIIIPEYYWNIIMTYCGQIFLHVWNYKSILFRCLNLKKSFVQNVIYVTSNGPTKGTSRLLT